MNNLMYFLIAISVGPYILLYLLVRRIKKNEVANLLKTTNLSGQIQSLGKTTEERDNARKLEINALEETTIKAFENEAGELVIKSPDGKTTINEIKLKRN